MPAYNSNTPLATQQINQTQDPIQKNFQTLQLTFDINHVDFADANYGKHQVTDFIALANSPLGSVPTFITGLPTGEFNIYNTIPNGNGVLTGVPNQGYPVALTSNELIIERALVAPQTRNTFIPITATTQGSDGMGGTYGWAFLPSGILLKWGYVLTLGLKDAPYTYNFPVNGIAPNGTIPAFSTVFNVMLTSTNLLNGVVQGSRGIIPETQAFTNTNFTVYYDGTGFSSSGNGPDFYYLAIGIAQSNT